MRNENDKIKLALEVIKKRMASESKSDTLEFTFEEFIPEKSEPIPGFNIRNLATETERLSLRHLFQQIQKENSGIEFTFPEATQKQKNTIGLSPLQIRELYKPIFYIYINDPKKFEEYHKKIVLSSVGICLILNNKGELYTEKDKGKRLVYPMERNGLRYRMVYFLATQKQWIQTKNLADEFETTPEKIRKTIESIKRLVEKFLKISGDRVIENKKGLGYRITNIKIKKS